MIRVFCIAFDFFNQLCLLFLSSFKSDYLHKSIAKLV